MIGRKLSHYEITANLGAGGMGVVYRAHDTRLNRDVAIKVLPVDHAISDNARARFKREALAASALNHPNIITIHEVNSEDNTDYIVMEYVRGSTLLSLMRKSRLSIEDGLRYSAQIADALAKAHAAGIIHRDLKPGNIMVTDDGLVKVLDFGLAKIDYENSDISAGPPTQSATLTQPGFVTGTVSYMSPEQARGEKVDARSDVFSFGIVMFEILSGKLPFDGPNSMAILHNLHFTPPRDLTELRPEVPSPVVALISRMLQKKAEKRIQTVAEVAFILRGARGSALTDPHTWTSHDSGVARLLAFAGPFASARARKRKIWTLAGCAVLAAALAAVGWHYKQKGKPAPIALAQAPADDNAYSLYQKSLPYLEMRDRPGNADKAIELLQKAVRIDPQSAVSYAALGEAYSEKNRENPDPQWAKLAADNASKAVAINGDLAAAHLALGIVKEQSGDSSGAQEEYTQAIQLDPKSSTAHARLGRVYSNAGKPDLAEQQFKRALVINPKDWDVYLEMGVEAYKAGRYKDAETFWLQVLKLQPNELRALVNLSAAYHAMGRDDDAAEKLQQALAIKPDESVYNNLGTIRYFQGNYKEAAAAFEKTVGLNANSSSSWGSLGDAYRQEGDTKKADQAYQQAIQLVKEEIDKHPDQEEPKADLAVYLARSGDKQGALQAIQTISVANEKDPTNIFQIAIAYEISGEREKALDTLAASIKAGQSLDDIKNEPDLVSLRADPRYRLNVLTAAAK